MADHSDDKRNDEGIRKPYERPRIEQSAPFERLVLDCADTDAGCAALGPPGETGQFSQ